MSCDVNLHITILVVEIVFLKDSHFSWSDLVPWWTQYVLLRALKKVLQY